MHPEAARLLESIEGELGVVTIAGPYRTGKSSLAGRAFLDNPKAFQSAPTVNPCTKVSVVVKFYCLLFWIKIVLNRVFLLFLFHRVFGSTHAQLPIVRRLKVSRQLP